MLNEHVLTRPGAYVCGECGRPIPGPHSPTMGSLAHTHECSRHTTNLPAERARRELNEAEHAVNRKRFIDAVAAEFDSAGGNDWRWVATDGQEYAERVVELLFEHLPFAARFVGEKP